MGAFYTYNQDTIKVEDSNFVSSGISKKDSSATPLNGFVESVPGQQFTNSDNYIAPSEKVELFTEQLDKPEAAIALPNRERNYQRHDWITIIIFVCIAIFASIRYTYGKYIKQLFLSLFNNATAVRMLNDRNYPVFHAAFRLELVFYIIFSLFVFQCFNLFKYEKAAMSPQQLFIIFGGVFTYFFGKKLIYFTLGLLFETQNETSEYLFNFDNFNRSLSLILLPVVILIQFSPSRNPVFIAIIGIVLVLIFNLILLKRGAAILLKKQFSLFYLFLYLCTLEILPLLLIYKVVV